MRIKLSNFFILSMLTLMTLSCSENNNGVQMQNNASTEIEVLRKFIQLPKQPIAVVWQSGDIVGTGNQSVPGPKDWGLIAVIKFKPGEVSELITLSDPDQVNKDVILPASLMWDWVKQELNIKTKNVNNYYQIEGTARNAKIFYQSPLLNGYWIELKENTILLYLYTR